MHVIVHIGAPKAGSSSIQNAIRQNIDALENQGVEAFRGSHTLNNRETLAMRFMQQRKRLRPQERWKHGALVEANKKSARRQKFAVLSNENFINLRNPVEQYRSRTDQQIRGGARFCDLMMADRYRHYPNAALKRYLALVGRERLVVHNFARGNLVDGDVVADFFARVEKDAGCPITLPEPPARVNESPCAAATVWLMTANETFRRLNDAGDRDTLQQRYDLIKRLRTSETLCAWPTLKLDDPELTAPIRFNMRDFCLWLNETFLDGQEPLTVDPPREMPLKGPALRARMRDWLLCHLTLAT